VCVWGASGWHRGRGLCVSRGPVLLRLTRAVPVTSAMAGGSRGRGGCFVPGVLVMGVTGSTDLVRTGPGAPVFSKTWIGATVGNPPAKIGFTPRKFSVFYFIHFVLGVCRGVSLMTWASSPKARNQVKEVLRCHLSCPAWDVAALFGVRGVSWVMLCVCVLHVRGIAWCILDRGVGGSSGVRFCASPPTFFTAVVCIFLVGDTTCLVEEAGLASCI